MKKISLLPIFAIVFCFSSNSWAADRDDFYKNFSDSTLRVDYIFGGNPEGAFIFLDSQTKQEGWAGRKSSLKEIPLQGNATITVTSPETGDTLYINSFSSLFQEWVTTPHASNSSGAFENSFLLPLPKSEAIIRVSLKDNRHKEFASHSHLYSPSDPNVRKITAVISPFEYIHKGNNEETIDVAMIAEGFTENEMDRFLEAAKRISGEILSYEPFSSNKENFSFLAVKTPSKESGVSIPQNDQWKDTAFGSHFNTFYSNRYLTVPRVWDLHRSLEGLPYEHIIVIVNTDQYGGGGIYNSYLITPADNEYTLPVSVHEFGHSFAGLADEYFYIDEQDELYPTDVEPWEKNITTLVNFDSKWDNMLDPATPIPTPWDPDKKDITGPAENKLGVYEGGGYRQFGVYRPTVTCRMRDNHYPSFCPVCEKIITEVIEFYSE